MNAERYRFDDFTVDLRRRILLRGDEQIPISSKNFDLLAELVTNDGRVLSHEELLGRVWDGAYVEQSNLKKGISAIRQVLGEAPDSSRFIKTVPRRGYAFVASVERLGSEGAPRVTVTEVVVEEEIIEDDRALPAHQPRSGRQIFIAVAVAIIAGSVLIAAYLIYFRTAGDRLFRAYGSEPIRTQKLVTEGDVRESGLSADGKFVAYALRESDGRESLWLRRVGALNAIQLVPPDNVLYRTVRVAPDGDKVLFGTLRAGGRDELHEVGILGGQPRKVLEDIASSPTFSPDGKRFAFARDKPGVGRVLTIFDMDRNNVEAEVMTVTGDNHGLIEPRWSPDGRSFSFLVSQKGERGRQWSLNEVRSDGSSPRVIIDFGTAQVAEAEWLSDGSGFLITMEAHDSGNYQLFRADSDGRNLERLTNDTVNYPSLTVSRDGRSILTRALDRTGDIWRADWPNVENATRLTRSEGFSSRIAVGPDGRIIGENAGEGDRGLVALAADGSRMTPLLDARSDRFPSVSPDGRSVVFTSTRSGAQEVWSADLGGGAPRRLTDEKSYKIHPRFSPDGNWIYFERYLDRGYQLVRIPVSGGDAETVRSGFVSGFDFSPDGQSIAFGFRGNPGEKWKIGIATIANPDKPDRTFDFAVSAFVEFTPDGKSLIYNIADSYADGGDLWLQPIAGGPPRKLLAFPGEGIYWADFGTDGKLYYTRGVARSRMLLFTLGDPKQ